MHIDDTAGISMMSIKAKAKEYKNMGMCDIVFIDYLQLCEEKGMKGRTREQEVAAMSRDAKIIAKELDIPVILLSQLSRKVEERKGSEPQLSDLRDSGSIEQDADVVIFIYRPLYYGIESVDGFSTQNYGEFLIEKNRHGRICKVKFSHNDDFTNFYDFGTI
jgi:replicative DNA helicase